MRWKGRPRMWFVWKAPYFPIDIVLKRHQSVHTDQGSVETAHSSYVTYVLGTTRTTFKVSEGSRRAI